MSTKEKDKQKSKNISQKKTSWLELVDSVDEFKSMETGQFIDNPDKKIGVIGDCTISRRSLKHFVEQRTAQNADIELAVHALLDTIKNPEIVRDNSHKRPDSILIGKQIPSQKKALMVVLTTNGEIITIHFKKVNNTYREMKDQSIASRGAAHPSSFSPHRGDLAASLSALQKQNLDL